MNRCDNRTEEVPAFKDVKVIFSAEDDAFQLLNDRVVFQHNVGQCQYCNFGGMVNVVRGTCLGWDVCNGFTMSIKESKLMQ